MILPALVSVKKRAFLLACSVCVMRCIALCVWRFLGLLGRDVHIVRRGAAMYLYRFYGMVCNWSFGVCGQKMFLLWFAYVLCVSIF